MAYSPRKRVRSLRVAARLEQLEDRLVLASIVLGTAADFAVLAGSAVTNTGPSVLTGSLGLSPGSSVTGFPPGY